MKIQTQCPKCGKDFLVWPYRLKNNHKPYCSVSCSASAQPHPRKRITLACPVCGITFERQPNELHHKKAYCSKQCQAKDHARSLDNPTWKRVQKQCETCSVISSYLLIRGKFKGELLSSPLNLGYLLYLSFIHPPFS